MKPLILKHLSGENIGRYPVWFMRQAGRYLESYRAIRKQHTFWEMVTKPEVAAEVSLLPLRELPVDGVIFFSDILTPPFGLGIPIAMKEAVGPVIETPLREEKAFGPFESFQPETHTAFVGEALTRIRETISPETTLLGFAGAPWTVGSYLIEGGSSRHFEQVKRFMYRDTAGFLGAMDKLTEATLKYMLYQHRSGAQLLQLFDTWLCEMPKDFFVTHYVSRLNKIFSGLRAAKIPSIYFAKGAHHLDDVMTMVDADVLSVDSLVSLPEMEKRTGGKFSLQGNLDPVLLLSADEATVRRATRQIVSEARKLSKPAIMNLGHGVLPKTPIENVRAFLEEARTLWI